MHAGVLRDALPAGCRIVHGDVLDLSLVRSICRNTGVRALPSLRAASAALFLPSSRLDACVGPSWTARSEHCGHPDRSIVDTEIGVVDREIATMDAEIGIVDSEIADRV